MPAAGSQPESQPARRVRDLKEPKAPPVQEDDDEFLDLEYVEEPTKQATDDIRNALS
jgi:hypothetical protein